MVSPRLVAKIESEEPTLRLAVLIDADNAQATVIEGLLAEIARFGEATVRRIYGDFTAPTSASWKKVLQQYAIKPVQQFAYTTGKNATDSTLIIDAMDLLYTRKFDGFCLVTSDSDFTGLAMRLREEGLTVLGFGEKKHRRRSAIPATSLCSLKCFDQAYQTNQWAFRQTLKRDKRAFQFRHHLLKQQGRSLNSLKNSFYPHLSSQATTLDGHILVPSEAISRNYSPTLTQGFMATRNSLIS